MKLKVALYSTSKGDWAEQEAREALQYVAKTPGIQGIELLFRNIIKPRDIPVIKHRGGGYRFDFDWLKKNLFIEEDCNVHVLHMPKSERSKTKSDPDYNGYYNMNTGDKSMEFVMFANKGKKAKHYEFSEFVRLFLHELAHGFDHWTTGHPNITTHHYDYKLREIHRVYEKEHSFLRWNLSWITVQLLQMLVGYKQKQAKGTRSQGKLAEAAEQKIGVDASPNDIVDDVVGCAESVTNIIKEVYADFPIITGTWTLWDRLKKDKRFTSVSEPLTGDIIISPTGTLANAPFSGHVGIVGENDMVMSSNSKDGKFEINYTIDSWNKKWRKAGYPVYFFRATK